MQNYKSVPVDQLEPEHAKVYDDIWKAIDGCKVRASLDVLLNITAVLSLQYGFDEQLIDAMSTTLEVLRPKVKAIPPKAQGSS